MRRRLTPFLAAGGLALAACDPGSEILGPGGDDAVITGHVAPSPAGTSADPSIGADPTSTFASAEARTVVIGQIGSGGVFELLAQAEVEAGGKYRIEGVPAGRSGLVIHARTETGAEIGSVVVHEETRAGTEHRVHPIDRGSSLHARVWTRMHAAGPGSPAMGSAELALFLHIPSNVAAAAASSETRIAALADAAAQAQAAITGVLQSEGVALDAAGRHDLYLSLVRHRDEQRHGGIDADAAHDTYVGAVVNALEGIGVEAKSTALAHAAASTAWDRALAHSSADVRAEVVRQALLLNIHARKRAAQQIEASPLGLGEVAVAILGELEAAVTSATSTGHLAGALEEARGRVETRVVSTVLGGLPGLGVEATVDSEGRLRAALSEARLWTHLAGTESAETAAEAVQAFKGEVEASAAAFVATLPAEVASQASLEMLVDFLLILGAGPAVGEGSG